MDANTAKEKFTLADQLYRQGRYEEALGVLSGLNKEFPNTQNVLYPAALCMEKLGRIEEAKMLCHGLIRNFDSQKARELLNHLEVAPRIAVQPGNLVDAMIDTPARPRKMAPAPSSGGNRTLYIIIGVVLALAVLISLPFLLGGQGTTSAGAPASSGNAEVFLLVLITIAFYGLSCYLMKRICENAGGDPDFLIWIPLLQIIPIMRAAEMSFLWLLVLLVPFVGALVYGVVLWVKLIQACNKPAWLIIFMFVPVLNIALLFYLAFSPSD